MDTQAVMQQTTPPGPAREPESRWALANHDLTQPESSPARLCDGEGNVWETPGTQQREESQSVRAPVKQGTPSSIPNERTYETRNQP